MNASISPAGQTGPATYSGMCNVLLRDPNSKFWQLSVDDDGGLQSAQVAFIPIRSNDPVLGVVNHWKLTVDANGGIVISPSETSPLAVKFIPLISPSGNTFLLTVGETDGTLQTTASPHVDDFIPIPADVSMSHWPVTSGVFCISCGNASVTVNGDLSCWCCVCNSYVNESDTNILVTLDE